MSIYINALFPMAFSSPGYRGGCKDYRGGMKRFGEHTKCPVIQPQTRQKAMMVSW